MTTKDALHQLVDRLPEDEARARAVQAILEYLATLPEAQLAQVASVVLRRQELRDQNREQVEDNADDTHALSRLSASALLRDWDSEADRSYDDETLR
jgi:hypothetical protein